MYKNSLFNRFASAASKYTGHPAAFITATAVVVVWACSRPLFSDFDTWQLVINTATTIVTFLMVFLIQNSQNRDTAALQIKLDELICANQDANNALLDIENLDSKHLATMHKRYEELAKEARSELEKRHGGEA